jgi:hypothetical protein
MTVKKTVLAFCMFASAFAEAAALNEIYVDFAVKAETPPVLDGKLDDPAWKDAIVHTRFYEYFKPHPKKAAIRSEMRLLYTDKALWIGLVHHEDRMDRLKVLSTVRDAVSWWEDMSELYIDPFGAAVGYTKLLVNSTGVNGDLRRIDGSVKLWEWSGDAWEAKTSREKDRWTIELCLPYSDLQMPPVPGSSMWRLCVTRYQWTSGGFVGSVSSPGGSNKNTAGFGYLWFLPPGEKIDVKSLASIMQGRVSAPWCTEIDGVMVYDFGEGVKREALSGLMACKRGELDRRLNALQFERGGELEREFAALKEKCDRAKAGGDTLGDYIFADEVLALLNTFHWKTRLESEFGGGK